ncbi:MAG: DUF1326 domain-containing protein [Gammaproteobacteria bacterium]|nr:DUF1326 domain-containing protein [Gammaproteobacteria bacterium]MDE0411916.1 DUF1326 domain-containing protein [Gammaproteobacteria bacterium]
MAITDWSVQGSYFESCTCENLCPCILLKNPTEGYCKAIVGWHIEKGHCGDVNLDGVKVGVWLHAPGHLTEGNWRLALYVDEQASDAQFDAICALWSGEGGGHLSVIASLVGEVMSAKKAKITYESTDSKKHLVIEGVGENEMYPMEGEDGKPVIVSNHPLAVAPGNPVVVHESKNATYSDNSIEWSASGKAGLASPFQYGP